MSGTTEAFARVKIDALLREELHMESDGWHTHPFELALPDNTQGDSVLGDSL